VSDLEKFFPNYDIHCTLKMINSRLLPFFSISTDFKNQQIIVIPPPEHRMQLERFKKWLFEQVLNDLPISYHIEYHIEKGWLRADRIRIIIRNSRINSDSSEETFNLFSKVFDRVLTKKNYIFDLLSFCLVRRKY